MSTIDADQGTDHRADTQPSISQSIQWVHRSICVALGSGTSSNDDLRAALEHITDAVGRNDLEDLGEAFGFLEDIIRDSGQPMGDARVECPTAEDADERLCDWMEFLGRKVRELRARRGMSQSELARRAGLTQAQISRVENATHSPMLSTRMKIAEGLGVPLADIDPTGGG